MPGPIAPALPLLGLTAATLAFGLVQALRLGPIEAIDFLKAWGLKGTAMFHDGNLQFDGLSGPNLFYPLQVSNLTGAFYVLLGRVDDSVVRLPVALFGVALALVLWWLVRDLLPPAGAALAVALAVATPQFTVLMTDGLADLVLAAYVTVCALAAYRWLEDGGERVGVAVRVRGRRRRLDEARGGVVLPGHPGGGAARPPLAAHARPRRVAGVAGRVHRALAAVPADPRHPAQPLALRHALPGPAVDRPPRLARRSPRRRTGACSGR